MENFNNALQSDFSKNKGSQEILLELDGLLSSMNVLMEKMKKTGSHVKKVKNNAYFHSYTRTPF